jgi:hypothetical protein
MLMIYWQDHKYYKENTKAVLDTRKDVGLEGIPHHQTAGQKLLNTANKCLENVAKFKYLRTTVTNETHIHRGMQNIINLKIAWYHSIQHHSSSCLLSKNVNINLYRTVIFTHFYMNVKLGLSH